MSAAALSYYITMTFFPIVICIYTMLGNSFESAVRGVELLSSVMPDSTVDYVMKFLTYVSENYSIAMMLLALSVIIITSSAAFRSIENTIGRMQGGRRFEGYAFFVTSIFTALLFLATVYLGIIAMFFGETLLNYVNDLFPSVDISGGWRYLRFLILFLIAFVIIWLIYELCKRKEDRYPTFYGALISTAGLVLLSFIFSIFINSSIKYPVVYGSLASVILLMFWLYCCCQAIYIGATFNITIHDFRKKNQ